MILTTIALTIILFIFIATFKHKERADARDFFLMNREGEISDYTSTTVAFSLQVAVTVYFIFWGYQYGLANIVFIITWGLGFYAFARAIPRLSHYLSSNETFFEFLSDDSKSIQSIGAVLFCASLLGLVFTEFYFTADYLSLVANKEIGFEDNSNSHWVIFVILVASVLFYSSLGGMRKVVLTDKWQLSIAYVSSSLFFLALAPSIADRGSISIFLWVFVPVLLLYMLLSLVGWSNYRAQLKSGQTVSDTPISVFMTLASPAFAAIVILLTIYVFFPLARTDIPIQSGYIFPKPINSMISEPYGWWPMIGFGVANLIWQFSDYTAYHRLSLLKQEGDESARERLLRRSVYGTILASPLTWSLGIFAGMAIDATGLVPDAGFGVFESFSAVLIDGANHPNQLLGIAAGALGVFLVSILMSTVDSSFLSIGQMLIRDVSHLNGTRVIRVLILASIGVAVAGLAWLQDNFSVDIFVLLNSIYSWGLVFGPVAVYRLFSKNFSARLGLISALIGAAVGFWSAFNPLSLPSLVSMVFPTLAALSATSASIIVGSYFFGRR